VLTALYDKLKYSVNILMHTLLNNYITFEFRINSNESVNKSANK